MAKSKVRRKKQRVYTSNSASSETNYPESNNRGDLYTLLAAVVLFIIMWAAAGAGIFHLVISSGGNITFAWIAAIVGGFIAVVVFLFLAIFVFDPRGI